MKKALNIFLLTFYSFGIFCLPMGDFSQMKDIPEMYRHCKATEDKDMTPFDFITDHLIDFDCLFDQHGNGDEQKPHQPIASHHQLQPPVSMSAFFSFTLIHFNSVKEMSTFFSDTFLPSDYITKIFRPPIV